MTIYSLTATWLVCEIMCTCQIPNCRPLFLRPIGTDLAIYPMMLAAVTTSPTMPDNNRQCCALGEREVRTYSKTQKFRFSYSVVEGKYDIEIEVGDTVCNKCFCYLEVIGIYYEAKAVHLLMI